MNNSKTPKIVVAVALVAVYATGLAIFTARRPHDGAVAQSPPSAVPTPIAAAPASPPLAIPDSADTLAAHDAPTPEASSPAATPAPIAPAVSAAAKAPARKRSLVASESKPRAQDVPVARVEASTPPARSDAEESSPSNSGSDAANEAEATAGAVAGESGTAATDAPSEQ